MQDDSDRAFAAILARHTTTAKSVETGSESVEAIAEEHERPSRKMASHLPLLVGGGGGI
jgi:hypothetical protein